MLVSEAVRGAHGGYDLHVLTKDAPALFEALLGAGAAPAGEDALTLARVVAGLPAAETEGGEGVLPQEAGLEPLLSYRKGCYLGQEIMARIEARGTVRRELRRLALSALPATGARDILKGGKVVGRLGAVAIHPEEGVVGLGVVRKDAAASGPDAGGSGWRRFRSGRGGGDADGVSLPLRFNLNVVFLERRVRISVRGLPCILRG